MTIDQLNKLTDEEVRVRVALQMGYRMLTDEARCKTWPCKDVTTENSGFMISPAQDLVAVKPDNYLADLNAAFTLVEKLRGEGWECYLENNGPDWRCVFMKIGSCEDHYFRDPSLARTISLAFLAVTEREEG